MKKYIAIIGAVFLFQGCDDSLDLAPVTTPSAANFYRNASDLRLAVTSVYAAFSSGSYESGRSYMFLAPSDNSQWNSMDAASNTELQDFDRFNVTSGMSGAFGGRAQIESYFDAAFVIIARANALLDNIGGADANEALKDRIAAEARFLRAYAYFDLVRVYGRLPMVTTVVSNDPVPLSSPGEVYGQIIVPDLLFAVDHLPAAASITADNEQGRASKGAAQTLLAKVYLTQGNNAGAEPLLRAVISSAEYGLLDNYDDLWDPANKNTAESIFELQDLTPNAGGRLSDLWMPNSYAAALWPGSNFAAQSQVMVTRDLIDDFDQANDIRFASTVRLGVDLDENGSLDGVGENIPFQWKYRQAPFVPLNVDENTIRLRYADVLLMLAEAVGGSEGYDLIDLIRSRAGLDPVDRTGDFTEALALERRLEFAFEMHRFNDLRRLYGDAATAQILQAQINGQLAGEGVSITVTEADLTKPIGLNEAQLNGW